MIQQLAELVVGVRPAATLAGLYCYPADSFQSVSGIAAHLGHGHPRVVRVDTAVREFHVIVNAVVTRGDFTFGMSLTVNRDRTVTNLWVGIPSTFVPDIIQIAA